MEVCQGYIQKQQIPHIVNCIHSFITTSKVMRKFTVQLIIVIWIRGQVFTNLPYYDSYITQKPLENQFMRKLWIKFYSKYFIYLIDSLSRNLSDPTFCVDDLIRPVRYIYSVYSGRGVYAGRGMWFKDVFLKSKYPKWRIMTRIERY